MVDFYGTVADFRTYHADRGRTVGFVATDEQVLAALILASEWLDGTVGAQLTGTKVGAAAQVREWPRIGVTDRYGYAVSSETVPYQIEYATYEVAMRQIDNPDVLRPDFKPSQYKRVAVDGAVSVEYANVGASEVATQFPVVWQILDPLLGSAAPVTPLSGLAVRA